MILARIVLIIVMSLALVRADEAPLTKSSGTIPATIRLLAPQPDKATSFMAAVQRRKTTREMTSAPLSQLQLSEILWCADGVNRPPHGRTAPSAMEVYSVEIYAVLPDGIYVYDPTRHELRGVAAGDFRKTTGGQDFVPAAPLNLVYVTDTMKFQKVAAAARSSTEDQLRWAALEAGCQAQNVYLYCAAEKLAAVIRAGVDTAKFTEAAGLQPTQRILAAQTVGQMR